MTNEVEKLTGIKPFTNVYTDFTTILARSDIRLALQSWAMTVGLPNKVIQNMRLEHLAKAYYSIKYLNAIQSNNNIRLTIAQSFSMAEIIARNKQKSLAEANTNANNDKFEDYENNISSFYDDLPPNNSPEPTATFDSATIIPTINKIVDQKLSEYKPHLSVYETTRVENIAVNAAKNYLDSLPKPLTIEITRPGEVKSINLGLQHKNFPKLLKASQARTSDGYHLNIYLPGPAGSGKTTAAKNIAKALNYEFEAEGSLDADYKLLGFKNAMGEYQETAFFRRFTQGGVMLLDEIDGYSPSALLALNSATANNFAQFPCGMRERHKNFLLIACANTWGLGATNDYVGRNKLDAASLDRFQPKIEWPIDEVLETAIAQTIDNSVEAQNWVSIVQNTRAKAKKQGLKIVISPRATFFGISLLQAGFPISEIGEMTIFAGLSIEQKTALGGN